jgi:hypothetical protein
MMVVWAAERVRSGQGPGLVVVRISREGLEQNEIPCSNEGHFSPQASRIEVLYLFPMQTDGVEEMQDCKGG